MAISRENYQITTTDPQGMLLRMNSIFSSMADRLDKIEGIRGGSNIESDLDMNDNTVKNVNITANDITANTLAVEDITMTGDMFFTGTDAGLTYGEISIEENIITETVIVSSDVAVQVTVFDANGHSHHTTSDHTEDHILIDRAGHYPIVVSATIESLGGHASRMHLEIMKNNGTSAITTSVA